MEFYTWVHEDKNKSTDQWKEDFNSLKENGFEGIFLGGDIDFLKKTLDLKFKHGSGL
jgi:hypothetical protein